MNESSNLYGEEIGVHDKGGRQSRSNFGQLFLSLKKKEQAIERGVLPIKELPPKLNY